MSPFSSSVIRALSVTDIHASLWAIHHAMKSSAGRMISSKETFKVGPITTEIPANVYAALV